MQSGHPGNVYLPAEEGPLCNGIELVRDSHGQKGIQQHEGIHFCEPPETAVEIHPLPEHQLSAVNSAEANAPQHHLEL
ncbi:palmitoyltransferase ZDHHC15 [Platysternon megacephalum]|uniref:Palmitoyltransferase ZDHHC15 n=1 Tax=Platysternon megacephalum TaxID=55544 RepID=A0A4D9F466_9SAUR|nr:palmitoyltransferase ZDHHC15 [Platysternon megacephalum]